MSLENALPTHFAPAERASASELRGQVESLADCPVVRMLCDALAGVVMVLNPERQVLWGNQALCDILKLESHRDAVGKRPGELFSCVHAEEEPGGCGTSRTCKTCGTATAIMASRAGTREVRECRLSRNAEKGIEGLDLQVCAAPLDVDGEQFTVFSIIDIGGEKRRRAIERIFLHDIANTASSVQGFAQILQAQAAPDQREIAERLLASSNRLISELLAQKQLVAAEEGELVVKPVPIRSLDLAREIQCEYQFFEIARGRSIRMAPESQDALFTSDPTLVGRVLGNMIKNALEASEPGEQITVGSRELNGEVEFWVHNAAVMPPDVHLQVFQRSFSTKGSSRGLGTYSMCLLSSRYLRGRVLFTSAPGEGTVFRARYPREWADPETKKDNRGKPDNN